MLDRERPVRFSSSFEARVLVEFHKSQTQRMHYRTQGAERDIQAVPEEQDDQHDQLAHYRYADACSRCDCQFVEYSP